MSEKGRGFLSVPHLTSVAPGAFFTPQPLRAVGVLFSLMVSGWAGVPVGGRQEKNLSRLYLSCSHLDL